MNIRAIADNVMPLESKPNVYRHLRKKPRRIAVVMRKGVGACDDKDY